MPLPLSLFVEQRAQQRYKELYIALSDFFEHNDFKSHDCEDSNCAIYRAKVLLDYINAKGMN